MIFLKLSRTAVKTVESKLINRKEVLLSCLPSYPCLPTRRHSADHPVKSRKMTESDVLLALQEVRDNVKAAVLKRPEGNGVTEPRLVAVSKTKPKQLIIAAYSAGQRHFGENYVQELDEKSHDPELLETCPDICWHLIGHLQGNKVNKVTQMPNLFMVETVDSEKLASALNTSYEKYRKQKDHRLKVMIQINTSGEKEKSGCLPEEADKLYTFVQEKCPSLEVVGIMTIGQYGYDVSSGPNPDFLRLVKCRKDLASKLGIDEHDIELSMGMSTDYEHAIELGSTNVRVGSSIFGEREKKH
ncbi:pyridoxal phosphate homeostasis protein isoform X1 [Frankliniella occidentalis]|uniref:Pyridoxal phosphate homeostasis protein n=2 Tax=Frankliniella occidentalis TaxID=133901 RepID=A0A6J1SB76_FRAOC|nr:pyridoxal phosphate homeostasis protein isoform X1 [Frankliniella occidentalis]